MRIAVYHNQLSGGAARVMEAYLRAYRGRHHFELFMPRTADTGFVETDSLVKRTHRYPVPGSDGRIGRYVRLLAVPRWGRAIAQEIDEGGFDVVFANLSTLTQAPEILPYLKTPSVYFCPEPLRAVYDREMAPEPRSLRRIARTAFNWPYDRIRARFDRRAIRRADRVFTNSKFTSQRVREIYGISGPPVMNGVDPRLFRPKAVPRPQTEFVLSVGALHPLKGHQFVIESLSTLPEENRLALTIVGSRGEYGAVLEREARDRWVRLEIRENVPTPKMVDLYNRSLALTAASYAEPFGLMVLEAMATETPVVAVNEGGFQESVTNARTGLLVPRDAGQFGAAIKQLHDSPPLARRLGQAGRRDVVERWRWSDTADGIDRILHQTAGSRAE